MGEDYCPGCGAAVDAVIELNYYGNEGELENKNRIRSFIRNKTKIPGDETLSFDPELSTVPQRRLPLRTDVGYVTSESVKEIVDGLVDIVEKPILSSLLH